MLRVDVPNRRSFWWIFAGLLAVVALAAMLYLANSGAAKAAIERQLAAYAGTAVHYETVEIRVWPHPEAEFHAVSFRIEPVLEGAVDSVLLRFALLPILRGEARPVLAHLERPALAARIPALGAAPTQEGIIAAYRDAVAPLLESLVLRAPGLAFEVRDGTLDLTAPGLPAFKLDGVVVDGELASNAVETTIQAHANLWDRAHAHTRIEAGSLAANVELQIDGLDVVPFLEPALAASPVRILPAASAVSLVAKTDGAQAVTAQLSVATPGLGITRNGSRLDLGASRARVQATVSPPGVALVVEELVLGELLPAATGSLKFQPGEGGTVLDAAIPRVDASRVRTAALGFADDLGLVRTLATFVQRGTALDVRAHAAGNSIEALADPGAYELSARVEAADIDVPALALQLIGASGSVRVAQRVLNASGVAAMIGQSSVRNGSMALALGSTVTLRELSAALDVDLAESLAFARHLQRSSTAPTALSRIQSITGRGKGTLALREVRGGLHQTYDVTSLQGTLRHAAVPLPIVIDGGGLRYETGGQLVLRGLAGSVGTSRVVRIDAALALFPEPVVLSASGAAVLALDDLYRGVVGLPAARSLRDDVSALTGEIEVKLARLAGPLNAPERLDMAAVLTPQRVRVKSRHLPATLSISGGTIRMQGANVGFDGVSVALQDARGVLSGSLRAYASSGRALDLSVTSASIGPRSLRWFEDTAGIAADARVRGPVAINSARVKWPAAAPWRLEVAAAAEFPSGARSDVDLSWSPGSISMRNLTLKDQDSDSRVAFDWEPGSAKVTFNGFVSERSVGQILVSPLGASGTLRGDFAAAVDLRDPIRSSATGKLEGTGVVISTFFTAPLLIDRVAIEADGDRFSVNDSAVHFAGELITLAGSIVRAGDVFDVNADVKVDGVDAEQWLARLRRSDANADASPWAWPLRGKIAVRAGYVDILGYRVEPLVASVALGDRKLSMNVTEARLCGLSVPLTLSATPAGLEVKGSANAQNLPVAATAACLTKNRLRASGTMDVSMEFAGSGAPSALRASARGSATLRARDGYIGGSQGLSEILALEDVNQRLEDAQLKTYRSGMPYRAIEIGASLAGYRVVVDRALLKSPSIDIVVQGEVHLPDGQVALTGVALPIVNALFRQVPVLGRIVGDPIVGIPFSMGGDIGDPQVKRVRAAAVGGALLHTLQSVVLLPVQLLGEVAGDAFGEAGVPARDIP